MIYVTIHDDSIEGTLKDLSVRIDDKGNSSEVSHRVQEKTNELLMGWERKRMEVMPDD